MKFDGASISFRKRLCLVPAQPLLVTMASDQQSARGINFDQKQIMASYVASTTCDDGERTTKPWEHFCDGQTLTFGGALVFDQKETMPSSGAADNCDDGEQPTQKQTLKIVSC